jgi:hypothetical protein
MSVQLGHDESAIEFGEGATKRVVFRGARIFLRAK